MILSRKRYAIAVLLAAALALLTPATAGACPCGDNCQCGPGCQCGRGPQFGPAGPPSSDPRARKNQSSLTDQERQDFVEAVLALKNTFRPGSTLNVYDEFVQAHSVAFINHHSHDAPAFLPWHRQFVLQFEAELQRINPNVTVPYWDFTVDNQPTSSLWGPNFLGGNGDPNDGFIVKDGPFRQGQWELALEGPDLRRTFGINLEALPTAADVEAAFRVGQYDAPPYDRNSPIDESFRNNVEGFNHPTGEAELHNRVHLWVGGSMAIEFSPNDPVFWLLHANIDRLWAEWQALYGLEYLPESGFRSGQNLNDRMSPFDVRVVDVLDHHALGYRYDTEGAVSVPEPSSLVLGGLGGLGLLGYGWRRARRAARRPRSARPPA